jgi:protein-S-isoprenylcysteine O-methyltransferase Ste14
MSKLILQTLKNFLIGAIALGLLLFLPAGTFAYWQAWLFIIVFMTSVSTIGVYLSLQDPELLERRKQFGPSAEQSTPQKMIMSLTMVGFLGIFVVSALDNRFGWSQAPNYVSIFGNLLIILGFIMLYFVFKENSFGSSNIQVVEGQKIVTSGPYRLVRHPMYTGTLMMSSGIPLALGSWWGLLVLALITPILLWRILDEEKLLKQELPGYAEYMQMVSKRLIPYVW